jgi:acetoacetate decarboxylase
MVVDDDTALILGREMLGFPKKMADIELEVDGVSSTCASHNAQQPAGATRGISAVLGYPDDVSAVARHCWSP